MSRIIHCRVNDEYVVGSGVPIGAAGSSGDVLLSLDFNDMWVGLSIVATFISALGTHTTVVPLMPSMLENGATMTYLVPIPAEAKNEEGRCKLTLSGYTVTKIDDNGESQYVKDSLTNTTTAFFRVLQSDAGIFEDTGIEPSLEERVLDELNTFQETIDEWLEQETGRENDRIQREELRVEAEIERQSNEIERESNEIEREQAENGRNNAETERVENESSRELAEQQRKQDEDERIANELARQAVMGDLDAALDKIIAIQDSLIRNSVSFRIDGPALQGWRTFVVAPGTTWGEWATTPEGSELIYDDDGELRGAWGDEKLFNMDYELQTLSTVILPEDYVLHYV